jgi:hypothetical protein
MRYRHLSSPLVTALGFLVILAASGMGAPALGADCGDVILCSCGDRVIADRTLTNMDPVVTAGCPGNGLSVANGVNLNLGNRHITGSGVGVGILIEDGANDVTIRRGKISGFGTGVATATTTTGSTLTVLQVLQNGEGIDVEASSTEISQSVIRLNEGNCLRLRNGPADDDGNLVTLNRCEDNWGSGLIIRGRQNTVSRNVLLRNGGDGADIGGRRATVDRNQAKFNGVDGIFLEGQDHVVTLNITQSNFFDGLHVHAEDSTFERNVNNYNGLFGIFDITDGGGTGGTDNTYINNKCTGNGEDPSSPPGLC